MFISVSHVSAVVHADEKIGLFVQKRNHTDLGEGGRG
jgi:hypothetical protein